MSTRVIDELNQGQTRHFGGRSLDDRLQTLVRLDLATQVPLITPENELTCAIHSMTAMPPEHPALHADSCLALLQQRARAAAACAAIPESSR